MVKVYKYLLIILSVGLLVSSLYMTLQLDMISTVGKGIQEDGFGNKKNIDNGNTYWTFPYLAERGVQTVMFFSGFGLISHALKINEKKDGHVNS